LDINALIQNFGFPISVAIACGWMVFKMYTDSTKQNQEREERNYKVLEKFSVSIDKFADVLEGYEKKLSIIENDVKEIKVIVNK
jgi:hypothetical protein